MVGCQNGPFYYLSSVYVYCSIFTYTFDRMIFKIFLNVNKSGPGFSAVLQVICSVAGLRGRGLGS